METASNDANRHADTLIETGNALEDAGELDAAYARYLEATRTTPGYAKAWINVGNALSAKRDVVAAIGAFDHAISLEIGNAVAYFNRGLAWMKVGNPHAAEESFRRAIEFRSGFADAFSALADALESQGKIDAAIAALGDALVHSPGHPGYLANRGLLYQRVGKLDAAEDAYRLALRHGPYSEPLILILAGLCRDKGKHAAACELFESAIARNPKSRDAFSGLLFTFLFRDDVEPKVVSEHHRRAADVIESSFPVRYMHNGRAGATTRRLRVGYVSSDFIRHAVANFALPLIEGHDRCAFEVVCYSNSAYREDVTESFERASDGWHDISSMEAGAVADLVHNDEIDILVDLGGHSGTPRLDVFALRPAPIQATWLGYLATSGLTTMDYRITDEHADPIGLTEPYHVEKLMRLPESQWCYRPHLRLSVGARPPSSATERVTFGSFNQFPKISKSTRVLWAALLHAVPNSRLIVVGVPAGEAQEGVTQDFMSRGIAPERIELLGRVDLETYFNLYRRVDVALDTTPYSGATTTCDALWMGVPVVTIAGAASASRSAASLLCAVNLKELIATTPHDYVNVAARLAVDAPRLAHLRRRLRSQMQASPLMDEARFVKAMENLYRRMWVDWRANTKSPI